MKISSTYQVKKWDEKPYETIGDQKATRASVEWVFSGDLEGTGRIEYLMFYTHSDPADPHKPTARYVGLFRITGKLKGKTGSFVLTDVGSFESGIAKSTLTIVPGSGTEELSKIHGSASYRADKSNHEWEMDVTF